MVDPYSGNAFDEAKKTNHKVDPYVHLADASYWDAIGTFNPWFEGSVRYSDVGAWINGIEKQLAYEDTQFWGLTHERNWAPVLDQDTATYMQARRRPARAFSQEPSQRPARRGRPRP